MRSKDGEKQGKVRTAVPTTPDVAPGNLGAGLFRIRRCSATVSGCIGVKCRRWRGAGGGAYWHCRTVYY